VTQEILVYRERQAIQVLRERLAILVFKEQQVTLAQLVSHPLTMSTKPTRTTTLGLLLTATCCGITLRSWAQQR
jgi:hypothetical protein